MNTLLRKPADVMVMMDLPPSKSGFGMQIQLLKARAHLEAGGQIAFFSYEGGIEDYQKLLERFK